MRRGEGKRSEVSTCRAMRCPHSNGRERDAPTGWSIQMVSARWFQLKLFCTHEPLGCTKIGPFCASDAVCEGKGRMGSQ